MDCAGPKRGPNASRKLYARPSVKAGKQSTKVRKTVEDNFIWLMGCDLDLPYRCFWRMAEMLIFFGSGVNSIWKIERATEASMIDVEEASDFLGCYHQVCSPAVGSIVWTRNYVF